MQIHTIETPNGDKLYVGDRAMALLEAGIASIEGIELNAKASDGVEITFGCIFDKADAVKLERYLEDHPTPDTW